MSSTTWLDRTRFFLAGFLVTSLMLGTTFSLETESLLESRMSVLSFEEIELFLLKEGGMTHPTMFRGRRLREFLQSSAIVDDGSIRNNLDENQNLLIFQDAKHKSKKIVVFQ